MTNLPEKETPEDVAGKPAAEKLLAPIQFLPGVGPRKAPLFHKLGLHWVKDVLFFFPRDYEDLTEIRLIDELEEGEPQSVCGVVEEIDLRGSGPGRSILGVLIRQDNSFLRALWYNQPFMRDKFKRGQSVLFSGKARYAGGRWEMAHPKVQLLAEGETPRGELSPVYPLTEGLSQYAVRSVVKSTVQANVEFLDEVFPESFLKEHQLWPLRRALPQVHFPDNQESLAQARRRFVYQELFILQLALARKRRLSRQAGEAPSLPHSAKIDARIRRLLPFELTTGQRQVIEEIAADLAQTVPMHRLLHGDVGSGKTAVALYAMLQTVAHEFQAVLMAPTEVLARQHYRSISRTLEGSRVRIALLTGGLSPRERTETLEGIESGQFDLVIGTQALVHSGARFHKLGLVVIDEQHKFGVEQRASLKAAGADPHYLVMTATPIPRTVALTLFGDLDVSVLKDSPPGRQPVKTYLVTPQDRQRWWEFFKRKLREGRQAYVITPLVDESEEEQVVGVEQSFEALCNGELEAFRVGLVHGRMKADEKERAMEAFRQGDLQVLVATSVVEVGVDVPNATLMMIENAERFGLAQLHQLRGRICRGRHPGYCAVFSETSNEASQARLSALQESTDGFYLADIDFQLRGPGELFGTKQHGMPPLRIADLTRDSEILEEARRDAQALIAADPGLDQPDHAGLKRMMMSRYGEALDLGAVG